MDSRHFLVATLPPPVGGVTVFVERRLANLRAGGTRVSVRDWKKMGWVRRLAWLMEILGRPGRPVFELHGYETWPMLALLVRPWPCRIVYHLHSARNLYVLSSWRAGIARAVLLRADQAVLVTKEVESAFVDAGWTLPTSRTIGSPWFEPDLALEATWFLEYPDAVRRFIHSRRPLMVMQGSEGWHQGVDLYGFDLAVDLLVNAYRVHPTVGLLVGRPSPGSTAFQEHVKRCTARLEEAGCLDALCVLDSNRRLGPAILRADLLLRPTADDGDSISIRDALFMGVPVVASDAAPRPSGVTLFRSRDAGDLTRVVLAHPAFQLDRPTNGARIEQAGNEQAGGSAPGTPSIAGGA